MQNETVNNLTGNGEKSNTVAYLEISKRNILSNLIVAFLPRYLCVQTTVQLKGDIKYYYGRMHHCTNVDHI